MHIHTQLYTHVHTYGHIHICSNYNIYCQLRIYAYTYVHMSVCITMHNVHGHLLAYTYMYVQSIAIQCTTVPFDIFKYIACIHVPNEQQIGYNCTVTEISMLLIKLYFMFSFTFQFQYDINIIITFKQLASYYYNNKQNASFHCIFINCACVCVHACVHVCMCLSVCLTVMCVCEHNWICKQ